MDVVPNLATARVWRGALVSEPAEPETSSPDDRTSPGIQALILSLVERAIIVTDVQGLITFMNPFAESLYGWKASEAVGRNVLEVTVPDVSRDQAAQIMSALGEGKSWSGEFTVQRRDGTPFVAAVTDTPVRDQQGRLSAIIGVSRDVTGAKRTEEALRKSEARFRALADEAPVGIFEIDAEGRTVYLNQVGQRIVGVPKEEALGTAWHDSIHPEDRERFFREWHGAMAAGRIFSSEYRFRSRNGQSILAQGYATALRDPGGRITGYIGVVIDTTETRALQAQLAQASRLAAIGTLVAGAAHQIDNPLAGSLSFQAFALETARAARKRLQGNAPLDRETEIRVVEELIAALEDAQEGILRISRVVKDMALFAGSAPGRIRVRLFDVVNQAIHWLPAIVTQMATVKVEDGGARDVRASAGQIEQVVVNLVTNAANATPKGKRGKVVVRIGPGDPGMARLDVIDQGTGIGPAVLERIFKPSIPAGPAGRQMGLGLAISQAIVTAHGGTLTVMTEVGKGSTFRVELPAAPAEA
jgi:PAS domain S-box-containing protein